MSFRLDWNGLLFVYSGDAAPDRFLLERAEGVDVLVHESFNTAEQLVRKSGHAPEHPEGVGGWAHTQPVDAGRVFDLTRPTLEMSFWCGRK